MDTLTNDNDSVIKTLTQIFDDALAQKASDIHFEPYANSWRVRLRIDGILYEKIKLETSLAQRLNSRLKVMAQLDIAERRLPQDGRFTLETSSSIPIANRFSGLAQIDPSSLDFPRGGEERASGMYKDIHEKREQRSQQSGKPKCEGYIKRDCRISTCPTMFGEKIVVRILNPTHTNLAISELGLNEQQQKIFLQHIPIANRFSGLGQIDPSSLDFPRGDEERASGMYKNIHKGEYIQASQGMILVTGPTGSGKTVTLYTALNILNTIEHNILTIEDPIEIQLPGINQVEVNQKIGLNFARALRAFLRQDPDIIMVGEIRDLETAQIAIKAAQTGHLVLATLHTNSAAASIMRLVNMEVAAFNLASSLNLLVAQRLVRTLCPHCKQATKLPENFLQQQNINSNEENEKFPSHIFQATPNGCAQCKNGYSGRTGIFELLPISPNISDMILSKQSQSAIEQQALQEGMISLRMHAWHKVLAGITSIAEINRVVL